MFTMPLQQKTVLLSMLGLTLALASELVAAAPASDALVKIPANVKQWLDKNKAEVIILDQNGKLQAVDINGKELTYQVKQSDQQAPNAPTALKAPAPGSTTSSFSICWGSPLKCWP